VGFVVPDLAAAMAALGPALGVEWTTVTRSTRRVRTDAGEQILSFVVTYSVQGPPHLELVESIPGTLWEAGEGPRLHHLGVWSDDVRADSETLGAAGLARLAAGLTDGDTWRWAYHANPVGGLLELVTSSQQGALAERIAGGRASER
jgi:hypothetical protein